MNDYGDLVCRPLDLDPFKSVFLNFSTKNYEDNNLLSKNPYMFSVETIVTSILRSRRSERPMDLLSFPYVSYIIYPHAHETLFAQHRSNDDRLSLPFHETVAQSASSSMFLFFYSSLLRSLSFNRARHFLRQRADHFLFEKPSSRGASYFYPSFPLKSSLYETFSSGLYRNSLARAAYRALMSALHLQKFPRYTDCSDRS